MPKCTEATAESDAIVAYTILAQEKSESATTIKLLATIATPLWATATTHNGVILLHINKLYLSITIM